MAIQLRAIGGSLMAIIPNTIVRKLGLKKGQLVEVTAADGKVLIEPAAKPDWASFFARDFGIPRDWELEREQFEDRDVFGGLEKDGGS
jgi:antitoxin component of MazEF toxin-antitoxin module